MLARCIIGSPDTVCSGMDALIALTGADKLTILVRCLWPRDQAANFHRLAPKALPAKFDHFAARSAWFAGVTSCAQEQRFVTP
jgi:hypothetical protein